MIEQQKAPAAHDHADDLKEADQSAPARGQLVRYVESTKEGAADHAALITKVHGGGIVNLTVFFSEGPPGFRHSVVRRGSKATTDTAGFWDSEGI